MEWIKIPKGKLPKGEVLAANFKPMTYGYSEVLVGYLSKEYDEVICEDEHTQLGGCTHYIPIHDFDIKDF